MKRLSTAAAIAVGLLTFLPSTSAQSNGDANIDVELAIMGDIDARGRTGVYPNGMNGVAISTTICNKGSATVNWYAPMAADHPFICPIVARETDGRMTQISDRSYIKHAFFALTSSQCDSCIIPPGGGGDLLGVNCSDTYSVFNNGDNYWLGPPDEIDPWLGMWDPVCSHFDSGEPMVNPPNDCDGFRSLTSGQASGLGPVGHRIQIEDSELNTPGTFWYQGYYVVRRETEKKRENNMATQQFSANWSGSSWNLNSFGALENGSILNRWSGANVSSNVNGTDDGRVYVAVKTSELANGMTRYEYAIHNRDNAAGVGGVRIPICPDARVENFGFHDIDTDAGNDWSVSVIGDEIVFETTDNPLAWNSFYNFWFDSDAKPYGNGVLSLDKHDPLMPGAASFGVKTDVPGRLPNVFLGAGCTLSGPAPTLYAAGTPAEATLGNGSFGIESTGNSAGAVGFLYRSRLDGSIAFSGCTIWLGGLPGAGGSQFGNAQVADGGGLMRWNAPIPNNVSLEGTHQNFQGAVLNAGGGPVLGVADLTDGLRVRIGNTITSCP